MSATQDSQPTLITPSNIGMPTTHPIPSINSDPPPLSLQPKIQGVQYGGWSFKLRPEKVHARLGRRMGVYRLMEEFEDVSREEGVGRAEIEMGGDRTEEEGSMGSEISDKEHGDAVAAGERPTLEVSSDDTSSLHSSTTTSTPIHTPSRSSSPDPIIPDEIFSQITSRCQHLYDPSIRAARSIAQKSLGRIFSPPVISRSDLEARGYDSQ
ncbi:hypothetical protein IAT38_004650 [Cryptococcus sp. DSM 104549]